MDANKRKSSKQSRRTEIRNRHSAILGIHPGALGDVTLFGELLEALRERRGGRVRLAAGGEKAALLEGLGVVDEAVDFDALPMGEVFAETASADCSGPGRLGRCGLLVSCLAAGSAAAERRLSELCSAEEAIFLPIRPPGDFRGHLVDLWAELAGVEPVSPPQWQAPDPWRAEARRGLTEAGAQAGRPYVLIHPGSGSREKCWPLGRFVELAERLAGDPRPRACVFVLGPTELDWWGAETIAPLRAKFPTILAPPLTLLAALAAGAAGYVGNDSGPSHLAAAVGAPTAVLFGPTDPAHFGPRGRRVRVIAAGRIDRISVESVRAALQKI